MIFREISASLPDLFSTDEQIRDWMAAAHTSETRVRIRRWATIEAIGMTTLLVGFTLAILAMIASIALAVWAGITGIDTLSLFWGVWGVTTGVTACGVTTHLIATRRRVAACFADGHVSVGTLERAIEHPGGGDDTTWYDLRISASLADGTPLRRRLHVESGRLERRVGGRMWFRHNSLDPDALDDVHFVGWIDKKSPRAPRERGSR
ncbi:hypothetical protein [Microbacterium sp. W4I4]|uniref:hypothetical protein n=1 Tax=Microbacterium sp. W4I4 TaxID=3042295 RepID=UPI0027D8A068|nr:hypothetical protein [Microbacterium sp. W4I4]